MENKLLDVEQRVKRYWYSDGIAELSGGGMFILLGLYFGIQGYFGENSTVGVILQVSLALLMMGGIFGVRWLVNALKTRLTYPRTGYVEYRVNGQDDRRRRRVVVIVAMIVAIASIVMVDYIRGFDSMLIVTGILVGVVFIALRGKSSGVTRFYAIGAFAILLGIGLSALGLTQASGLALFYGLMGLAILISGGLVLRRYLIENPMPSEADNE